MTFVLFLESLKRMGSEDIEDLAYTCVLFVL